MNGIRRALFIAGGERYAGLFTSFITLAVVSRLLTPTEIGVSVVGLAIMTLILSVREFAATSFIIQHRDLRIEHVHSTFIVVFFVSVLISAALVMLSGILARFYAEPQLVPYLYIGAASTLIEVVGCMVIALLRRDMAFGTVASINISAAVIGATVTLSFAVLGFSSLSFAWGMLASSFTIASLSLYFWRDWSIFRFSFQKWREMAVFGGYNGVTAMLARSYEALPAIALGHILSLEQLALYSRAITICQLPDRAILRGLETILLPAFSMAVRNGRTLGAAYLRAIEIITAVQWPAFAVLAVLADPLVHVLLGHQWGGSVPLVRIMAIASLFSFSSELNYPVLVAMGSMRDVCMRSLVAWPISALVIVCAAFYGVTAAAMAWLVTLPFQAYISIWFVRRHVDISWLDIARALKGSMIVTLFSVAGPLLVAISYADKELTYLEVLLAAVLSAIGWLMGLKITEHALFQEIEKGFAAAATILRAKTARRQA